MDTKDITMLLSMGERTNFETKNSLNNDEILILSVAK